MDHHEKHLAHRGAFILRCVVKCAACRGALHPSQHTVKCNRGSKPLKKVNENKIIKIFKQILMFLNR